MTKNEFKKIPLIGGKKSQYIITKRKELGQFRLFDELRDIFGIGEKTVQSIKNYIHAN